MHYTTLLTLLAAAANSALAAPHSHHNAPAAVGPAQWTIRSYNRHCNSPDTDCQVSFTIDPHMGDGHTTKCKYTIKGNPASQASSHHPVKCGPYTVTWGWSGHFGPGKGFTTLSVVDNKKGLIIWPAYSDTEMHGGKAADKQYTPVKLG